jgi:hypothetical protein
MLVFFVISAPITQLLEPPENPARFRYRQYQRTAHRMTSPRKCRHLKSVIIRPAANSTLLSRQQRFLQQSRIRLWAAQPRPFIRLNATRTLMPNCALAECCDRVDRQGRAGIGLLPTTHALNSCPKARTYPSTTRLSAPRRRQIACRLTPTPVASPATGVGGSIASRRLMTPIAHR